MILPPLKLNRPVRENLKLDEIISSPKLEFQKMFGGKQVRRNQHQLLLLSLGWDTVHSQTTKLIHKEQVLKWDGLRIGEREIQ